MILRCVATAVLLAGFSTMAFATTASKSKPTLRDQEQAACYDDAMTLCKDAVPDEQKIEVCMRSKMAQVSAGCKKFFK
jgi:hypothetical protein